MELILILIFYAVPCIVIWMVVRFLRSRPSTGSNSASTDAPIDPMLHTGGWWGHGGAGYTGDPGAGSGDVGGGVDVGGGCDAGGGCDGGGCDGGGGGGGD